MDFEEQSPRQPTPEEVLDGLGKSIADKREEAVKARKESGIEEVWLKCEESYIGMDDANRHEFKDAKWAKPTSMEGPVTSEKQQADDKKSTIFVPLTARYVDAGSAKLSEILLPADDKNFSMDPTPVPELIQAKEVLRKALKATMQNGGDVPATLPVPPGVQPQLAAGAVASAMPDVQAAKQIVDQAIAKAKAAEQRIYDWLIECGHRGEMRKIIHDSARIGVGVVKGPFADEQTSMAVSRLEGEQGIAVEIQKKVVPATKWVDPWNFFPDGTCGEDVQDGEHCFERDYMSPKALKKLKKQPGYLPSQIDKVIKEGPDKANLDDQNPNSKKTEKRFKVWYFYGAVSRAELIAANAPGVRVDEDTDASEDLYAIVTLVNDTVIRAVLNPLESGDLPYRTFSWRRRSGHWAGVGVSEQVDPAQRIVNGATRAMLNNAGKAAGAQIVVDQLAVEPADGQWVIVPDKLWFKAPDATWDDVRKVFMSVEFPSRQEALMAIINYGFRLAEESTNIPLITQGMSGTTTPDTYGAAQLQNNNANQLLRDIGYRVDESITEPTIRGFYEWLLLDPDIPDDEKGDWKINAHGSVALVERYIQDQTIQQMGGMVLNPAFGVDPKKWFAEFMKTKHLDPRTVQYAEGEEPQSSPPIQLAIEQMRGQNRKEVATIEAQSRLTGDKMRQDRDLVFANVEQQVAKDNAMSRREEMMIKRELALLQYANQRQISLDQVKKDLAKTSIMVNAQKQLAAADIALEQRKVPVPETRPPVQVPGRAPNGHAFEQV